MVVPQSNLNLSPLKAWLFPMEQPKPLYYLGNSFSSISFIDEKNNSEKGLNLKPLGCKGDNNHCIIFFL
jgi:hypothetical protein